MQKDALLSQLVLMQYVESHPHILKLLGCCTTGERLALVVEYCALGTLREFLTSNRRNFQVCSMAVSLMHAAPHAITNDTTIGDNS